MTELVGQQLGKYEIQRYIGGGGMADVYQGHHPGLQRLVAVKVLKAEHTADRDFVDAFVNEARTAAQLGHPHIVTIHDVGEQGGVHYIVMEYVDGQDLQQMIRAQGGLPPKTVCQLFDQIADALNYAHRRGFVHCDVKPSNIMLDHEGRVKLTDFGIARAVARFHEEEGRRRLVGSPRYMSPEHVLGKALDHRSDIYSLGVVLFEMLTGRVPFDGGTSSQIMRAHVSQRPPLPSTLCKDLPKAADEVVLRALAKDPEKRYQNALQMARDVRQALLGTGQVLKPVRQEVPDETIAISEEDMPAVPPRRLPALPLGLLAAAIVLVALVIVLPRLGKPGGAPAPTPRPATATLVPAVRDTLVPTATRTPPMQATATGTPTTTPTLTWVPPTITPTRASTQAPSYTAPELLEPPEGAGFNNLPLHLRWQWPGQLKQQEWFDVWMWPRGEAERSLQWTRSSEVDVYPPGGVGVYFWKVRIVRGEPGQPGSVALSPFSTVRSLDYKGGAQQPQPEPTRP